MITINSLMDKKVLITGGTGFIGKRVVEKLTAVGATSYILTRNEYFDMGNVKYIKADLNQIESIDIESFIGIENKFDFIIYLAANIPEVGMKKETYLDAKTSTLDPVIKFCEKFAPYTNHFVYASSIDVMGTVEKIDYTEIDTPNPVTPYAIAKYCGEIYAKNICNMNGIGYTALRFSQVYGANEPVVRIIPILIGTAIANKEFNLFTTGEEKRRFLYVDDAAEAIIKTCETRANGIYNIAGRSVGSINELIQIVEKVYDVKLDLNRKGNHKGIDNIPNIDKAKIDLGFEPEFDLLTGIKTIKKIEKR